MTNPPPASISSFAAALVRHRPPASHWRVVEFGGTSAEPYLAVGCRVVAVAADEATAEHWRVAFPTFHLVQVGSTDAPEQVVLREHDADLVIVDRVPSEASSHTIEQWLAPAGLLAIRQAVVGPASAWLNRQLEPRCIASDFAIFGDRRPPRQLVGELGLDRTACVDRDAVRRAMLRTPWTPETDPAAELEGLLGAFARDVAADTLDVRRLPWPAAGPPSDGRPHCETLAILPHPDDETVYAGGILHGLMAAGERVHLVVATDGAGGRGGSDLGIVRARELLQASAILGLTHVENLAWPDFGKYRDRHRTRPVTAADTLRAWNWPVALRRLVQIVRRHRPARVLSLDPEVDPNYSLHGHHLGLGALVALAFHAAAARNFAPQLGPAWAAGEHLVLGPAEGPGIPHAIDRRRKLAALRAHASQRYSTARLLQALDDPRRPAIESVRRAQSRRVTLLRTVVSTGECRDEELDGPGEAERTRTLPRPRTQLVELLRRQAEPRPLDQSVHAAIDRLSDPRCVAVVTGQQVGLFGGLGLTLVKACAAIALSRRLSATGVPAVPVFWLASYDHDVDEVATVARLEHSALRLRGLEPGCPVGTQRLGPDLERVLAAFIESSAAAAPDVVAMLRACYRPDATLADAFAEFLGRTFAGLGLVILDPADPRFARLARPVLRRELLGPRTDEPLSRSRARRQREGLGEIVPTQRDHLQLFYRDHAGRRRRLRATATGVAFDGGSLDAATIERLLTDSPERFTPAALLRPIVQDAVLPTIAYVAGPTEARYLDQARELYDWADVPRPPVITRPSMLPLATADVEALLPELDVSTLVDHPRPFEMLARAGLSDQARAWLDDLSLAIAELREARAHCRAAEAFELEGFAHRLARLEPVPALPRTRTRWQARRERLRTLVESLPRLSAKNRPASTRSFTRILRELTGLRRTMLQEGRRQRPDAVAAFRRIASHPAPAERRQTTAELLARAGPSLPACLVAAMERDFAARYVVQTG